MLAKLLYNNLASLIKKRHRVNLCLFCFVLFCECKAQNLVPNPSFETYYQNESQGDNIPGVIPFWSSVGPIDWFHLNNNVPPLPYLATLPNNYLGRQLPRTGIAYAGFFSYLRNSFSTREMPFVPLNDSLEINKQYCVSFYLSMADTANYANSLMSALFMKDTTYLYDKVTYSPIDWTNYFTPQVTNTSGFLSSTTSWMKVENSFVADSTYKYMVIGLFTNLVLHDTLYVPGGQFSWSNPYGYYYLDDVSVTLLDEPVSAALSDTIITTDTSTIQLGNNININASYIWSPALNISDVSSPNPILNVTQSGWYYVQKTQCSYVTYDSVYVKANLVRISEYGTRSNVFSLVPNPNNGEFSLINTLNKYTTGTLFIYDSTGKLIETQVIKHQSSIDVKLKVPNGIYFLRLADASNVSIYLGKILVR